MADIGKAPKGFPRRMQAARALAGLTIEQLAGRLTDEPGLGERSLRNIENGTATIQRSRQNAIMEACGLPPRFVTADLWFLEPLYDVLDSLSRETYGDVPVDVLIQQAFRALTERDAEADLTQRVANLERALDGLTTPPGADDDGPVGPLPGSQDDAADPEQQRLARGQTQKRRRAQ